MATDIKAIIGGVNTSEDQVLANVRSAIRRQLPQVKAYPPQQTPVVILAGGPSLEIEHDELRECLMAGMRVVCVNGAYQWAISHDIRPHIAIALDAKPENAAFFRAEVPGCHYLLASQCSPEMFDAVEGRNVSIWHALSYDVAEQAILNAYYGEKRYSPVTGGSTVTVRAISLLRLLGFLRMDLFGFDSCWMDGCHHAYPQAWNDSDLRMPVSVTLPDDTDPEPPLFECATWHLKQAEDFQMLIRERGHMFQLHVHGDGLIAYMMKLGAGAVVQKLEPEAVGG